MSEKFCLQWNDFKENIHAAFGRLRDDTEFADVTLVCEDGQLVEAHKVILAASSPVFQKILQEAKHPRPLVYLKGFQLEHLQTILDFLYFGEVNVYQENLDSFLAIAEELKLKGLSGQTSSDLVQKEETPLIPMPVKTTKELFTNRDSVHNVPAPNAATAAVERVSRALAIPDQMSGDLQALDEKVKSMMEKTENMIPAGKRADGKAKREQAALICKVCGKEGQSNVI